MAMRKKMSRSASKRNFKSGAKKTRKENLQPKPMRGGFRL